MTFVMPQMGEPHKQSRREGDTARPTGSSSYNTKSRLQGRISALTREIHSTDESIADLQRVRAGLVSERSEVNKQLSALSCEVNASVGLFTTSSEKRPASIDYSQEFEWSAPMKMRMKKIFGIESFRLCQESVCNACMDGRDVVCVMPTGGGKSLTYQLPAIMNSGCTVVISPLISLITDQILHLREAGVDAVMLTSSTSNEDSKTISRRLATCARNGAAANENEIKLLYVTPEKIAQSKSLVSLLEKLSAAGKLARIVIDEAHCVSQLGHDFRPDYKKLSVLKQFFPYVPILALSATCPPKVLSDLLKVLRLKPVVDGSSADRSGTLYFSAPLYRSNLHYRIVPKPSTSVGVIKSMVQYILRQHPRDSGIVYCFSKKETEAVAQGLNDLSEGKIRAGVYHADVKDAQKERLHVMWRSGEIQVVCATIAFGLGIDKADVRFVLHHSMSKSLDGFYQESGRAGRDGKDADCVLYYRGQDASRLSALACADPEGSDKLHAMVRFAQDLTECRKIQFAQYFSTSSPLSLSAWSDVDGASPTRCGHCDNCTRAPHSISTRDMTLECWKILKVLEAIARDGGRVTITILTDLVRGGSSKKISLDLDGLIGGKITMKRDDTEALIIHLLLLNYLKEDFYSTTYTVYVYVVLGPQAVRLTRFARDEIAAGEGSRISIALPHRNNPQTKSPNTAEKSIEVNNGKEAIECNDDAGAEAESSGESSGSDAADELGESDEEQEHSPSAARTKDSEQIAPAVQKPGVMPPPPKFAIYVPRAPARKGGDTSSAPPASASASVPVPPSPPSFFVSSGDEAEICRVSPKPNTAAGRPDDMGPTNSSDSDVMLDEEGWSFSMSSSAGTKRTASMSQSTGGSGSAKKRPRVSSDKNATVHVMELSD